MGGGSEANGAKVIYIHTYRGTIINGFDTQVNSWLDADVAWRIWKLIPVSRPSSEALDSGSLPLYGEDATGPFSTRAHHAESERDDFGTIVTEVTYTTTRKRYRVEDA